MTFLIGTNGIKKVLLHKLRLKKAEWDLRRSKILFASLNQDKPQTSPLMPAVMQDVLSSHHLPPTTLLSFGTRMPGNLPFDSSTHLSPAKASHTDHNTDLRSELQGVIQQTRALEEHQAAMMRGAAPTSPQPTAYGPQNSAVMSPLTIHQPFPSMPTGETRGAWSTTRDRIQQQQQQQQQLQQHPGTTIPTRVPGSEVSQMYRQTNVKTVCTDVTFLAVLDLLEIELFSRAHEDEEEKRYQNQQTLP